MGRPKKIDPPKQCMKCKTSLMRKTINGRLEDRAIFLNRKYCNQQCMALAFVKDAPSCMDTFHWRARKLRGTSCESCGTTAIRLCAHHIDENEQNNSSDNIQTLCNSCHSTHHHHARRAGLTVAGRMASHESQQA